MKNTIKKSAQVGILNQVKPGQVKAKPNAAEGLRKLFVDELKDIYWAEKALTKAIPKMIKNATSKELIEALTGHLKVTKEHVTRIEVVFTSIGERAVAKKCEAMAGLIKEAEGIMEQTKAGVVRDAGIISAAQKVEHYEMATYGTLRTFAKNLSKEKVAVLLNTTLEQEREADQKLSEIAQKINMMAADQNETEEDTGTMVATKVKRK